jgi:uncharacterized membrane protein YczE
MTKETNKIRVNGEFALLIAIVILSVGIVFVIKADLGMTVVQAPVYVLSLAIPEISIGIWNSIVQGSLFVLMILIVKQFKISYLLSFLSGIIYGLTLDFFTFLMSGLTPSGIFMRIVFFAIGFLITAVAVAIFFTCQAPLMPYDIFLREVAGVKKMSIPKFKWIFDISCVIVALILSFSISGRLLGIGWGTLVFAFVMSPFMAQIMKLINKIFIFVPLIKNKPIAFKRSKD